MFHHIIIHMFRFYIKCTAGVSEICFRTDPENTDYVLESGNTVNLPAPVSIKLCPADFVVHFCTLTGSFT